MESRVEKTGWMSVPQFGGWDDKGADATNYSVVFSRARANRKQHKRELRASIGCEKELTAAHYPQDDPIMRKKKILTYINCCIRPS